MGFMFLLLCMSPPLASSSREDLKVESLKREKLLTREIENLKAQVKSFVAAFVIQNHSVTLNRDFVVRNGDIRVSAEPASGRGNLIVGNGHTVTGASNSFVAGYRNTVR